MKDHVHHWLLETPHGPTVAARCKRCGKTREYSSWGDDTAFGLGAKAKKALKAAALKGAAVRWTKMSGGA